MCPHAEAGAVYAHHKPLKLLYMCTHTTIYVSSYYIYVSSYYMCPHAEASAVRITSLCICIF